MTEVKKIKVACISDSPLVTSGFGVVNKQIIDAMIAADFDVHWLAAHQYKPAKYPGAEIWNVPPNDPLGHQILALFLSTVEPDVIFVHYDPGNVDKLLHVLIQMGYENTPKVALFPVEGMPLKDIHMRIVHGTDIVLSDGTQAVAKIAQAALTYCDTAADSLEKFAGERPLVQRLGANHANFKPLEPKLREKLRELAGIHPDVFLVVNVAYNKRPNRHPALIRAASMLEHPILLYLHTDSRGDAGMHGPELRGLATYYDVKNVIFRSAASHQFQGVVFSEDDSTYSQYFDIEPFETKEESLAFFMKLPLALKYGIADLYIDPSSVQGWNLPTGEALLSGLNVISVDDGLVRTEVFGHLAYKMMKPDGIDWWVSGVELQLVSPENLAYAMTEAYLEWKHNREAYCEKAARSCEQAREELKWDLTPLIESLRKVVEPERTPGFTFRFSNLA